MNSDSEYKYLRSKVDELMKKTNSTKVHNQKESGKPTPSKTKGTTKKPSWTEVCDKYGYPIIYWQIYVISHNLSHISMDCKLPSNTHTPKQSTLFNHIGQSTIANKAKPNKWQVGSGRDTHLSNNVNFYIIQYPVCSNQNIPSKAPTVDTQSTKKTRQMDSKSPKLTLQFIAALGITILPLVIVRPWIMEPQRMRIPKRSLVLRLAWFMSPSHLKMSQQHQM